MAIMTPRIIDRVEQATRKMSMRGNCHGCARDGWLLAEFTSTPGSDRVVFTCGVCGFENAERHPPRWDHLRP